MSGLFVDPLWYREQPNVARHLRRQRNPFLSSTLVSSVVLTIFEIIPVLLPDGDSGQSLQYLIPGKES
jgi:hypothetical protein